MVRVGFSDGPISEVGVTVRISVIASEKVTIKVRVSFRKKF